MTYAQGVRLVKDITPGPDPTFSSSFVADDGIVLSFGERILFIVENDAGSFDLWTSDGEEDGTYLLQTLPSNSQFTEFLNEDEDYVFYSIYTPDENYVYSLSKTTVDTLRLYQSSSFINDFTYLNGQLFFDDDDALIKVDPATQTAELVYQFGSFRGIKEIGTLNDQLIIIGGENNGTELYYSDGTNAGTQAYYQLNDGSDFSGDYYMTQVDDQLFFFYNKPGEPYILYSTDGTADGTLGLIDLERISNTDLRKRRSIIGWDGKLFFLGRDVGNGSNQDELFVSDGTVSGTFKININDEWSKPAYFTPYKGELYFKADEFGFIFNVFKTDGTQNGTVRAIESSELGGGLSFGGDYMTVHEDSLYFYGFRSEVGEELWSSDGTTSGTVAYDIVPGEDDSVPTEITSTENYLFMLLKSPEYGKELFVLDRDYVSTTEQSSFELTVHPNPFTNYLELHAEVLNSDQLELQLFNSEGKLVFHTTAMNHQQVALPKLPKGAYSLVLKQENKVAFQQLVKL